MQNEPNFPESQMNVNKVLTKDYENISNWTLFENKPNTKPIQTQTKPISEAKKMLLRLTINTRRNSFRYHADEIEVPRAEPVSLRWNRVARKYRTLHSVFPKMTNFSLFIFGYQLKSRFWTLRIVYEPFLESVNYEK